MHHILPTANHQRFLVKISFRSPLARPPVLTVGGRPHRGIRTDSLGSFWAFDVDGLEPETDYQLALSDARGSALCEPWPLATFPDPATLPTRFRVLVFTCAGGHDVARDPSGDGAMWVPVPLRRRLLERAATFQPDAIVAIGDHVYWDLRAGRAADMLGKAPEALSLVGQFERMAGVIGTENEGKIHTVVGPQIADLYGTLFRSTPSFFVQDDHDYFENDHADRTIVTFPPDDFMLRAARATQWMYYPEFLPDDGRPLSLPSSAASDRVPGIAETFGTLRYGSLAELLIYDCRRFLTLAGDQATFIPDPAEAWIKDRLASSEARHVVNVPSTPPGWSAGKWGEWYPDVLMDNGQLGTAAPKFMWQSGWRAQHDRLLEAASRRDGIPLFLSGDLHAIGHGRIHETGSVDLGRNPVETVLTGPVSTGPPGWPSAFRGVGAMVPTSLSVDETLAPLERNGFTLVDFTPDRIDLRFFSWKLGEPERSLDHLEPFHTSTLEPTI